jgi:hypothetical protein
MQLSSASFLFLQARMNAKINRTRQYVMMLTNRAFATNVPVSRSGKFTNIGDVTLVMEHASFQIQSALHVYKYKSAKANKFYYEYAMS